MEKIILASALASEIGLIVRVSDYQLCLQRLYAARRAACDPLMDQLQFRRSPENPANEIWIMKSGLIQPKRKGDLTLQDILDFKA